MPLALALLIALALLSALFLEAAMGEFRSAGGALAEARAAAATESAAAAALALRFDISVLNSSPGSTVYQAATGGPDSATALLQVTAPPIARIVVGVVVRQGHFRAIAGRLLYVKIVADPAVPGEARLTALGPFTWFALP